MKKRIFWLMIILFLFSFFAWEDELTVKSKFKSESLINPWKVLLSNKRIFILDKGDESVKVFNRDGNLLTFFGRKGQGPGEFINVTDFCISKDKIYILDGGAIKIEVFSVKNSKHLRSEKITISNPFRIAVNNSKIFVSSLSFLKGQKIISTLLEENGLKVSHAFLDCIPVEGIDLEKIYQNFGFLTSNKGKIYFAFILSNKVLEFSEDGHFLNEYSLPFEPIKKPEIDKKGTQMLLKSANIYDIRAVNGTVYLLSNKEGKNSVIYMLENNRFIEKFKIKEILLSFDISNDEIWGIEGEAGEVLIYKVKE